MVLPTVAHLMLFNNKRKLNPCHEFVKNKQMSDAWRHCECNAGIKASIHSL